MALERSRHDCRERLLGIDRVVLDLVDERRREVDVELPDVSVAGVAHVLKHASKQAQARTYLFGNSIWTGQTGLVSGTDALEPTRRTELRRRADRGRHERVVINAILDEALIGHLAFVDAEGRPMTLPMAYARVEDQLYLHGAIANHGLRSVIGRPLCFTVTLLDGLVLSRSAFHHSMNYRCAVLFGSGRLVDTVEEKLAASVALVEHQAPGRRNHTRLPSESELRATTVIALGIDEGSAKIRTGPPVEDPDDVGLPYWGGVLPLSLVASDPIPDDLVTTEADVPDHLRSYTRLRWPRRNRSPVA